MNTQMSENLRAILLLTAPLIVGAEREHSQILTLGEYNKLAARLHQLRLEPASLLDSALVPELHDLVEPARLAALLGRGLKLGLAVERWRSRAIWVVSRADAKYPARLRSLLKSAAPPILYGCGDESFLSDGGLAVVGSRNVEEELLEYSKSVGRLAGRAGCTIVSGGARGVDQAAMSGALTAGGQAIGVLADSLMKQVLAQDTREMIASGHLLLVSPFDPAAGFNVGNAMQRNKVIYMLADAALVVRTDLGKGGTWAGATEHLSKFKTIPVYVRPHTQEENGLAGLVQKGGLVWPEPANPTELAALLHSTPPTVFQPADKVAFTFQLLEDSEIPYLTDDGLAESFPVAGDVVDDNEDVPTFETERTTSGPLAAYLMSPRKPTEVAAKFGISLMEAKASLEHLAESGVAKKSKNPVRYVVSSTQCTLFEP